MRVAGNDLEPSLPHNTIQPIFVAEGEYFLAVVHPCAPTHRAKSMRDEGGTLGRGRKARERKLRQSIGWWLCGKEATATLWRRSHPRTWLRQQPTARAEQLQSTAASGHC